MSKPDWAERIQRSRNKMFERGVAAERERIIKLLKSKSKCKLPEHDYNGNCYCDTIALIKGETE